MLLLLQGICRRYLGRASYKSCDGWGGTLSFMVVFLLEELTLYQSVAWIQESEEEDEDEEDEDEEDSDWSLSTTVGKCVIQRWCFHWVVLWLRWRKLTRSTTPYIKRASDANISLNGTYKLSSLKIALLSGKKNRGTLAGMPTATTRPVPCAERRSFLKGFWQRHLTRSRVIESLTCQNVSDTVSVFQCPTVSTVSGSTGSKSGCQPTMLGETVGFKTGGCFKGLNMLNSFQSNARVDHRKLIGTYLCWGKRSEAAASGKAAVV